MSLESDNLKLKNTQVNPASTQVVAGQTTVSNDSKNKPIDFKAQDAKVEEKAKSIDSEIIKFVNSEEFKSLSPENQVQVLKERFMPGATPEEINKTISLAKQSAQNTTETSNNVDENSSYELSGNESDVEKAAYAYIEKQKLKDVDIDGLRSMLASKANRTPEEEKLFNQIQEAFNKTDGKSQDSTKAPLVSAEDMLVDDWKDKSQNDKLDILADNYFEKTNARYAKMSDIKKQNFRINVINNLARSLSDNDSNHLTNGDYARVPQLLNALNRTGMSIEEYNKLPKSEKIEFYRNFQKESMKELKNLIPEEVRTKSDKWQSLSATEKLTNYADAFLTKYDPNYPNLTLKEKEEYITLKANEMISEFGVKNWDEMNETSKERMLTDLLVTIDATIENDMSYDEFQNLSLEDKMKLKAAYRKEHNVPTSNMDELQEQIITDFVKETGKDPTIDDLINIVKADESISPDDKQTLLDSLNLDKELNDKRNTVVHKHVTYASRALSSNHSIDELIDRDLNNLAKTDSEKQVNKLTKMFCQTNGDVDLIEKITNKAKELNLSEDMINQALLQSKAHKDAMVSAVRNRDGKKYSASIGLSKSINDQKSGDIAAYNLTKVLKGKAKEEATVGVINEHQDFIQSLTKGINDFEPDPVSYGQEIASRSDISDAGKSLFTQSIIETSPTPERQLEYGRVFSQIDNAAVTEGLAAASKSVDKSVRSQYDSYVDKAISQYPPEQQSVMRSARESGQVSQETLSKTSVESNDTSDSVKSSSSRTSRSANTSTVAKNPSVTNADKTVVSSQPSVGEVSQTIVTAKTQTTQSVAAKADSIALQQKKEALLNKIVSYETKKAETTKSTKKSESVKSDNSTKADNKTVKSQADEVEIKTTGTTAATDVPEELQLTEDEQEILKAVIEDIFQKNSVSAAYSKLLETLGESGKDKFLEAFVQRGKEANVRAFAEDYKGNPDTLLKLIGYCQSESLKFDLLKMLPSSSITELISTQKLTSTDFDKLVRANKVESKEILTFLTKNKDSMSFQDMKKYMSFLSLADRNALMDMLRNTKGSDEWLLAQQENMRTVISDVPSLSQAVDENGFVDEGLLDSTPSMEDGLTLGSNKVSMRGSYNKMKKRGPFFLNA